jgi:hypothetical protein
VLPPGWALVCQPLNAATTGALDVSFFWEAMHPRVYERIYSHAFVELELNPHGS